MKDLILEKIGEIEAKEKVQILYACESGSRAWGFPSPDSDYDVRMIYVRPTDWYLTIYEGRDVIETPLVNNFDVGGWDLKKTLALIHRSNAVVWEWLQSPTIYSEKSGFRESLLELANGYFSPKSAFHHYLSMAKKVNDDLGQGSQIKLKKLFYVIRPMLAARWIAEGKGIPPMDLQSLIESNYVADPAVESINELVQMKSKLNESQIMDRNPTIDELIADNFRVLEQKAESIPSQKGTVDQLDNFFREVVHSWK